jgi:[acyl-carrier-protein] S-malonyltransferase
VLLFGAQSSRDAGMFDRLEAVDPVVGRRARERAARHAAGDPTDFSSNRTIQVSVVAATLGWLEVVNNAGLTSTASAGLSLGEYAHLVDIGALDAESALALVAQRGALYDTGPDGAMAAIFPAARYELGPLLERIAAAHGGATALAPAVFNSPTQTVVAGSHAAVAELMEAAEDELYARGVIVEDRIPMHTLRFHPVAEPFRAVLAQARWTGRARVAYRPNVGGTVAPSDSDTIVDCLARHVWNAVQWRDTVDGLVAAYPDAVFLETGPRTVLRDLMMRRWHQGRTVFAVDALDARRDTFAQSVTATLAEVARALGEAKPIQVSEGVA